MKIFVKYALLFICFAIGIAFAIGTIHAFVYPGYFNSAYDAVFPGMFAAIFLLGAFLLFRWKPGSKDRADAPSQYPFHSFEPVIFENGEKVNRPAAAFQGQMSNEWHYVEGDKTVGPVDLEEIQIVLSKISDPRNLLVWKVGLNNWQRAGEVPELANLFYRPPSPSKPMAPVSRSAAPVGKPRDRDWKWTFLQSILYLLIVSIVAVGWHRSGFVIDTCFASHAGKEARYVGGCSARCCPWPGSCGLQVYCARNRR
jgi:uncharacterized protein DUF4339